jgi:hypothetical protein
MGPGTAQRAATATETWLEKSKIMNLIEGYRSTTITARSIAAMLPFTGSRRSFEEREHSLHSQ